MSVATFTVVVYMQDRGCFSSFADVVHVGVV